ncbi:MAG: hypothetical protein IMF19_09890 [Proteobacteria bacterium]|nr:hypothetical protein [Pseudomonadota bacterium]
MIYIDNRIEDMEGFCKRLDSGDVATGFVPSYVRDAVKIMKMWRYARTSAKDYEMGQATKLQVHRILEDIEERFFPSIISQGFKIKIEGESMAEIQIRAGMVNAVEGVKEVRMHDKDC